MMGKNPVMEGILQNNGRRARQGPSPLFALRFYCQSRRITNENAISRSALTWYASSTSAPQEPRPGFRELHGAQKFCA